MKKLIVLVIVAALIGLVISKLNKPGQAPMAGPEAAPPKPTMAEPSVVAVLPLNAETPAPTVASQATPISPASSQPAAAPVAPGSPEHPALAAGTPPPAPATEPKLAATTPAAVQPAAPQSLESTAIQRAAQLVQQGKRVDARKILSEVYRQNANAEVRQAARKALDEINKDLVFNPHCTVGAQVHTVGRGEKLASIAKDFNVSWRLIARLNGIERPERLRERQDLKIISGPTEILVDKSDFRLALFINGDYIKEYRIAHGKDNKTPVRVFVVDQMLVNPDWYPPEGGVIKHGEKGHLIGDRWIGFKDQPGATGLGIHGTSEPASIGTMCSNGCIRMTNEDVAELYDFASPGVKVTILE